MAKLNETGKNKAITTGADEKKKRNSTAGAGHWLGLVLLLFSLVPFISLLKALNRRKKMTTTNNAGYDLYDLLKEAGFSDTYRRFIVAQAAHESDNFSSPVYKENNNPFGIKFFGQDEAEGEKGGYAYYLTVGQAVQDYKRIFKSYGFVTLNTLESFVKLLQNRHYFEATYAEYLKGCKWFYLLYFPKGWEDTKVSGAGGSW